MPIRHKLCLALMLLASPLFGAPALAGTNETRAAAVLLDNFETVFHTTPAMLSDSTTDVRSGFPREPFGFLFAGLDAIGSQIRASLLENSEAILVGAKDYHLPLGLGRVQSTRCYIVVLRKNGTFELSKYFNKAEVATAAGGAPVWYWSAELQEFGENDPRPSALFATQIAQSYILISNKLEGLGVSGQLVSGNNDVRVLAGIGEWNDVSQHDFWGYRKYRHGATPDAIKRFLGTDRVTPAAQALIVYLDLKQRIGVLRLLSASADDATAKNINAARWIPPFKPVGPGVWETVFPLDEVGQFADSANSVLWLFGWGVLV